MFRVFLFSIGIIVGCSSLGFAQETTPFEIAGRYVGVLHNEILKRDQRVQLDILVSNEGDDDREIDRFEFMAFLKLQFGDWSSSEYMTYHFDNIKFNSQAKTLPLVHPDQEVSVILNFTGPGQFTGTFRSNYGGNIGEITLSKLGDVPQKYTFIEPVAGKYEGVCGDGSQHMLHVVTFRNTDDTTKIGNPFSSYRIHANWARKNDPLCIDSAEACVEGVFDRGTYNFFDNDLVLMGPRKTVKCQAIEGGIKCRDCEFKRVQNDHTIAFKSEKEVVEAFPGRPPIKNTTPKDVGGIYRGYVYHEYLGTYQRAELNIQTFQEAGVEKSDEEISMSAVAQLFFGEFSQREAVSYRFATRVYPVHKSPFRFSFQRPQADLDAVIHVEEIGDGIVRGTWYSLLFGRVGQFEMRKEGEVQLPPTVTMMKSIAGFYRGPQWDINLIVELGQTPFNSDNPFHPLTFSGWTILRNLGFRVSILDGSYDFYTGKLGFILSDGSDIVGIRDQQGNVQLKKVNHMMATPLKSFDLDKYEFVSSDHPF
ncbi:MAG: hypothetical protein ACKN9V_00275 [Pseudomonadota bacterium]